MLEGKKALVIGSSGFIGSQLLVELLKQGVVAKGFDKEAGFNIGDRDGLSIAMQGVDYVFHLAVLPFNPCAENIRLCVQTNIIGTLNVVEAARSAGVKKLIYSSASAVYGNIDTIQAVDENHPCNPDSMYGASKLMSELIVKGSGVPYIILRYMNVYGEGQKNGLIPTLLRCVKADDMPPIIDGDGSQSFDFVHVSDVVKANMLAATGDMEDETFNVGGENEITVSEVVRMVLNAAHSELKPMHRPVDNKTRRVGSSNKARRLLGYHPSADFNTEIRRMVNEYISENEHTNH